MTSETPSGDPPRPDADDWWGDDVPPPPPAPSAPTESEGTASAPAEIEGSGPAVPGRRRWLIGAAVAAVVLAIGVGVLVTRDDGGSPAAATTEGGSGGPSGFGRFGGTNGTITDIDAGASTLVLETSSGDTVHVTATDDTTVTETVDGSVDDLSTGDNVVVIGSSSDEGTIAAQQVVAGGDGMPFGGDRPQAPDGAPPEGGFPGGGEMPDGFDPGQDGGPAAGGGRGGFTSGTIDEIGDGELTVRTADDQTVTVTLSSSTTIRVSRDLSFGDLAEGDEITVVPTDQGQSDDGGTVEAAHIRRGDGGFGRFPGGNGDAGDGTTT